MDVGEPIENYQKSTKNWVKMTRGSPDSQKNLIIK